jgi:CRISPR/Cas system CSM-associated protein Csm3 (group 7 of RAMP superfamily)
VENRLIMPGSSLAGRVRRLTQPGQGADGQRLYAEFDGWPDERGEL